MSVKLHVRPPPFGVECHARVLGGRETSPAARFRVRGLVASFLQAVSSSALLGSVEPVFLARVQQ